MTAPLSVPCRGCSSARSANLVQLGVNPDRWDYLVTLAGNPNTGKSTVFNALTGLRQHTGNWPGENGGPGRRYVRTQRETCESG